MIDKVEWDNLITTERITALQDRVETLEAAIRKHRDYRGDHRCHLDDGELYAVLPEGDIRPARETAVTIENCQRFIDCRQQGREYVSPQDRVEELERALVRETKLFNKGLFRLASGAQSDLKIDCDALTDSDLECVAHELSKRLPAFGSVHGVPRGGLRLAQQMEQYTTKGRPLIVDDVWTTGSTMKALKKNLVGDGEAVGAVIFARTWIAPWVHAWWGMSPEGPQEDVMAEMEDW